jgi:hypothetical protein
MLMIESLKRSCGAKPEKDEDLCSKDAGREQNKHSLAARGERWGRLKHDVHEEPIVCREAPHPVVHRVGNGVLPHRRLAVGNYGLPPKLL